MSDEGTTTESNETVTGPFKDPPMTYREHMDPDKHWIGETLAPPTQSEIASTIGSAANVGESPFPARADHTHKLDTGLYPYQFNIFPGAAIDATTGTSTVTWLTSTGVLVPTWAKIAYIQVNLASIYMVVALGTTYYMTATLSGSSYTLVDFGSFSPAAINQRESTSFACYCTVTAGATGARNVLIGAKRAAGTGTMRADTISQCTGFVFFNPA